MEETVSKEVLLQQIAAVHNKDKWKENRPTLYGINLELKARNELLEKQIENLQLSNSKLHESLTILEKSRLVRIYLRLRKAFQ